MKRIALSAAIFLSACGQTTQPAEVNRTAGTAKSPTADEIATATLSENKPATVANGNAPLAEPKGAIDPTSAEAAGQVVQHYGALIEQRRWSEGWTLWSSADAAKTFERNFRTWSEVHLEIGKPGDMEGAAGSIYVTVPVTFYGRRNGGGEVREHAEAILRRVNDVPGSTEQQRRWHIERIDWGS
jgi:hypothetical protein